MSSDIVNGTTATTTEVLSERECWELLGESVVGRLAVVVGGRVNIFPVNPVVDHGSIVFRTSAGTKLAGTKGQDVAFEVDGYDPRSATAWSVVAKGPTTEVWDVEATMRALRLPLVPWQPGRKPRIMRIEPDIVTGRRFVVAGGLHDTTPPTGEDDVTSGRE
jgi:nitroimidazol reductase NimA-like FMN-containing flavoprotein (pyridoxamine 5'-phosphate oxidase superfamily)